MTSPIYFDTDCISAFLWVDGQSLITKLYNGRVYIPYEVYSELSHPAVSNLKNRIDSMVNSGEAYIETMEVLSAEYSLYLRLTNYTGTNKVIGKGEAACLALAKYRSGIVASNNLKDISKYLEEYELSNITTGDIIADAVEGGLINEEKAEEIWKDMLDKKRLLGAASFNEYKNNFKDE